VLHYHRALGTALAARSMEPPPLAALEELLELAIADLTRWLSGFGWKTGVRAPPTGEALRRRARAVLDAIDGGEALADEAAYTRATFSRFPPDYHPA
jgi:hypothetical protein